ncbi:undecaprenyl/decaprenyl-phosphate alpha-N-acetylglucosaminyl 1-phosphate transferase [Nitriliruptoraceae bacterium ZYF776]|nr:undecaprenyl/decaprenyl-phosphate alpha-N-acetylglucosaminyl 1-phosphate transferase [Profundirhabdus halotolerans]
MWSYLAVATTAAVVTGVVTPLVGRFARRIGAVDVPQDPRKVHRGPVPTLGGIALLVGLVSATAVAAVLPGFAPLFGASSEPVALLLGAAIIVVVGIADDLFDLPPTVKLAGQLIAALAVVLFGIQLVHFWVPGVEVVALSRDLGVVLTVVMLVAMINAVNLIDGLDGLAAGVVGIAAVAFFVFTLRSETTGLAIPTAAPLLAAVIAGLCVGFLVHNTHPARIFMGDTGSMLLGLLLGAAGISYVGRTTAPSYADFYGSVPLFIPALVLAVPFLDTAFAIGRRLIRRQPITAADRGHLHHLLLAFGHSHRRAVLVLYYWSALLAVASVGPAFVPLPRLAPWLLAAAGVGAAATVAGARTAPPVDADDEVALRVAEVDRDAASG